MTWNYRIVRHRTRKHKLDLTWYGLHEVYYNKAGKMYLWATDPEVTGDTPKEIVGTLATMLRDATKDAPILEESLMPGQKDKAKSSDSSKGAK